MPSEGAQESPLWPLAAALEGVGVFRRSLAFRSNVLLCFMSVIRQPA